MFDVNWQTSLAVVAIIMGMIGWLLCIAMLKAAARKPPEPCGNCIAKFKDSCRHCPHGDNHNEIL